jgi:hypothetical protein
MTDIGPEVRTARGMVRGRRADGLAIFRGIPFAQPPVDALRFAAPQPTRPWQEVDLLIDELPAHADRRMAGSCFRRWWMVRWCPMCPGGLWQTGARPVSSC